jgi:hypothetical protein
MKSYEENGWMVTTPVYAGSSAEVQKANRCAHEWMEQTKPLGPHPGLEKCKHYVAVRA